MAFLQGIKYAIFMAFIFCLLIFEISAGVFQGIRIPQETPERYVGNIKPLVDLKQGTVQGKADLSRNGRLYLSFLGIPYGKIPERFNMAVPADGWDGILKATEYGPSCPQVSLMTQKFMGEEDCLSINVFVPKIDFPTEPLPVMVYIYGGAFTMGESKGYLPKYLMDEDVIQVIMNYRVGPFGFLNAGIRGASGNQALKDLSLGLKWVQENIGQFGGNASRVTIYGYSAGGAAVAHLVASPMAKGLFSGAIAQSGMATIGWSTWPDPNFDEPRKLAQALDCPTSNREYMVECLRRVKPEMLAWAAQPRDHVWFDRANTFVSAPTIETYREYEDDPNIFQSENVEDIWDKGTFNRVPFMIGMTANEGLSIHAAPILLNPNKTKELNEKWGRVLPQALFYWSIARDPCVVSSKLRRAYFQERAASFETGDQLIRLYSDIGFEYPARKVALKASQFTPVYLYNFTRPVSVSFVDAFGWWRHTSPNTVLKPPTHADDVQFLFNGVLFYPEIKRDSPDYEFSVNIVKYFTSFAKNGKPTHTWGSESESESEPSDDAEVVPESTVPPVPEPVTESIPEDVELIQPVNTSTGKLTWTVLDDRVRTYEESDSFLKRMKMLDGICRDDFDLCSSNMK